MEKAFYCWVREQTALGGETFRAESPSRFWDYSWSEKSYTVFAGSTYRRPKGYITVSLRSRQAYRYGFFQLNARLPDWGEEGPMLWFGFESEDLFGGGVAHYMLQGGKLRAFAGAWPSPTSLLVPGLPEDYASRRHTYTVRVHENMVLWFIDERLRAAMILTDSENMLALHEGPPYSLGVTMLRPGAMGVLLDIDGGSTVRDWSWDDIHPWQLRVSEGSERPRLYLKLYRFGSDEPLEGGVEGTVASHPVPAGGSNATFSLSASEECNIRVEASTLDARWVVLDEAPLSAGNLLHWERRVDHPFVRVVLEAKRRCALELAEAYVSASR